MKKFIDIINADPYLNKLNQNLNNVLLAGNLLIINSLKNKELNSPGYNNDKFIEVPEQHRESIFKLVQSLWEYENIHLVDDFLLFELPARVFLENYPAIRKFVDKWISGLEIFV